MEQAHTLSNIRENKKQKQSDTNATDEFRNVEVGVGYQHRTVQRQKGMTGEDNKKNRGALFREV